jgi:(p)ppGpp synthase/HD superfamily hydrolase
LESLEIYAPIANRLGMGEFKGVIEDLSFKYINPAEFERVTKLKRKN